MNITIQRADLARTLTAASRVVESRNTIPILANVLLVADGNQLQVIGTDLDIEVSVNTPATGEAGSTTVDARRLADIAKRLVGDTVSMELKDGSLVVKSGRSRFTLPTLPVEDYPRIDSGAMDAEFKVDLAALVASVKFAISSDPTRYFLCGVNLHVEGDTALRAIATDGHRLSLDSVALPAGLQDYHNVIIPAKTVGLIPAGGIDVSLSKNKIRFATADTIIVSKLIDGTFPDYKRVIPAKNANILTVDRSELSHAVARVASVATERGKAAKFTLTPDNLAIDMRSDDGTAHEDLPVSYEGPDMEIGFNSQYLGDVLGALTGDTVTVRLGDPGSPALFNGDGDGWIVLMPMRAG